MKKKIDMINGPLFSSIIRFALPIIFTGLLQVLYNNADIIIVGQFATNGQDAVGAIGSTTSLVHLIVNMFMGLSVGTNVALAHSLGRQDNASCKRVVHSAIAISIVCGLLLTVIGVLFAGTFLSWMNVPAATMELSSLYLKIYFFGMPASMIYNFGAAILNAKGDTKRPLLYLSLSGIINVLLNCFFVVFFDMSVDGVALATIISQYFSAVMVVIALIKETDCCKLVLKHIRFHARETVLILKYGIPTGLTAVMFNISNVFIQTSLNSFDSKDIINASSAAAGLEGMVYTAMTAFCSTSMTFTGQNVGAQNYKRISKIFLLCTAISFSIGFVFGYLMYAFGTPLLRIYLPDASDVVLGYGLTRMRLILLFYLIEGIMEVQMGVIRGMGYATIPSITTIITVCLFRIIWIFTVFAQKQTLASLFVCYPISWIISVIVLQVMYMVIYKKIKSTPIHIADE